ncbi:hypothetical protein BDQ12DRAFT_630844, partial [Crucibulum laeve]
MTSTMDVKLSEPEVHHYVDRKPTLDFTLSFASIIAEDAIYHHESQRLKFSNLHPGTRESVLRKISLWTARSETNPEKILWVYGPPQTGKSTIAYQLCRRLDNSGQLAASFFFSRTSATRNNASFLIPTLVYQLAMAIPALKPLIEAVIQKLPFIMTEETLETQAKRLIYEPLMTLGSSVQLPVLVIIDALDECIRSGWSFLETGVSTYSNLLPIRFVIFTRPKPWRVKKKALHHFQQVSRIMDLSTEKSINDDI